MVEIFYLTVLSIVPGFVWLALFLHEDWRHPEPRSFVTLAFFGGMVATAFVFFIQNALHSAFFHGDITELLFAQALSWKQFNFLATFAAVEEIAKFLVVWVLVRPWKAFDEPLDAMIYMIIAGLGFAVVENIAYTSALVKGTIVAANPAQIILLRAIGSTLLHAITSAVIGYHWALAMLRTSTRRFSISTGIAFAVVLHVVFNYLIITAGERVMLPFLFLAVVLFFILIDFQKVKHKEHLI